ncbi:MAG: undecaprenyl-diphosphate phosphatase [Bdellovibrionales bacterium]
MNILDAIILGVVQGLTEFLPISSSGHLVIAQKLLGIDKHDLAFDLAAHVGTLLSIFTIYAVLLKRLVQTTLRPGVLLAGKTQEAHLILMVIIGSIPTALIGFGFKRQFEEMFDDMWSLGICFIITGGLLLLSKWRGNARFSREQLMSFDGIQAITWQKALFIGAAQGLSIAPSISRSGITIVAGLLVGVPAPTAAMYSFIMSIPAVAGAAMLELRHVPLETARLEILGIGFVTAYLAGVVGLWGTLQSVRKGRLEVFTGYLVILGILILWFWT